MARRWAILLGTSAAAVAMSSMLLLAAPAAMASPSSSDTETSSTTKEDRSADRDADTERAGADRSGPAPEADEHDDSADEPNRNEVDRVDSVDEDVDTVPVRAKHAEKETRSAAEGLDVTEAAPVTAESVADDPETGVTSRSPETDTPRDTDSVSVTVENVEQTPARAPSLVNVVGSVVLNLLVGLIHVIDGPPMLPANSTVTVRTSSLNLPIGAGRTVQAAWYFPDAADESTRLVYLQHGFLASGPMYSYTAARLAERTNAIVVAPSLTSNFFAPDAAWVGGSTMHRAIAELFVGERRALTESASAAASYAITLPRKVVLVGHSAGGTLVTSAAGFMADNGAIADLAGVVMLDGVEPAGSRLVGEALAKLRGDSDRPIYLISSERYFWSRGGDMADKIALARPGRFNGVGLKNGLHIDYMEGGNPIVQFGEYLVAGFSLTRNIDAASDLTVGWVNDLFSGSTADGVYGAPGESIPVVTPSGAATAVVLPLGNPARPVWPPLLDVVLTAIFDFAGNYLFVYEPLRGFELQPTG